MTIFDRPLVIEDRPTLVDPLIGGDNEELEEAEEPVELPSVIGEGGGISVHGVEFEEDSEDVIKGANLVAMLATGESRPTDIFKEIFINASIQLNGAKDNGRDISELASASESLNAHTIGVEWEDDEDEEDEEVVEDDEDEEASEE